MGCWGAWTNAALAHAQWASDGAGDLAAQSRPYGVFQRGVSDRGKPETGVGIHDPGFVAGHIGDRQIGDAAAIVKGQHITCLRLGNA